MAYFPAFINLDNLSVLIVGGGNIACDKLKKMLDFTKNIKIIAPNLTEETKEVIDENSLLYELREYMVGDIKGHDIVIVGVDDLDLQKAIYSECKKSRVLCNCVDFIECCDFIFPSYIKDGDLVVAISTSGTSPSVARELKFLIKRVIPKSLSKFLKQMRGYRDSMPKGRERMEFLDKRVKEYFKSNAT